MLRLRLLFTMGKLSQDPHRVEACVDRRLLVPAVRESVSHPQRSQSPLPTAAQAGQQAVPELKPIVKTL